MALDVPQPLPRSKLVRDSNQRLLYFVVSRRYLLIDISSRISSIGIIEENLLNWDCLIGIGKSGLPSGIIDARDFLLLGCKKGGERSFNF